MLKRANDSSFFESLQEVLHEDKTEKQAEEQLESGTIPLNNTDFYNEDNKISGLLQESNRKTMPDFMSKLAEEEKDTKYGPEIPEDYKPEEIEFEQETFSRAKELTSDESRNVESRKAATPDEEEIQKEFEKLLAEGIDSKDIIAKMQKNYPLESIKKFVESSKDFVLKYSQLGHTYIDKNTYTTCEEMREHFASLKGKGKVLISKIKADTSEVKGKKASCKNCTKFKQSYCLLTNLQVTANPEVSTQKEASVVLANIRKNAFIDPDIMDEYTDKLAKSQPIDMLSSIISSMEDILTRSASRNFINKVAFNREDSEKDSDRIITKNNVKNAKIEEDANDQKILEHFKKYVQAGLSRKATHDKLIEQYNPNVLEKFYSKFAKQINSLDKFMNRKNDLEGIVGRVANESEIRNIETEEVIDPVKQASMKNIALNMLTTGYSLNEIKTSFKKAYSPLENNTFFNMNATRLEKEYGQIGYNFIDSNIYDNCDNMKKAHEKITDFRKQFLYNVKASSKCDSCTLNITGKCEKVGLRLSNSPIIRSSRSAQKHLSRTASILPKGYIDQYQSKVSDSNMKLISEFNLGAKQAFESFGTKKASNKAIDNKTYDSFKTAESYDVDLFDKESKSSIVDDIMKEI